MSRPVVTTTLGVEGLPGRHGDSVLVADSPAEFTSAITRVLDDPGLAQQLGAAGRRLVEAHFSWSQLGTTLRARYLALASGAG
jgi:glycosyltransferase involved in cell wall biosynthesis